MRRRGPIGIDLGESEIVAVQFEAALGRRVHAAVALSRRFASVTEEVQRLVRVLARRGFQPAPVVLAPLDTALAISELRVPAGPQAGSASSQAVPVDMIVAAQLGRLRKVDPQGMESAWWPVDRSPSGGTLRALAVGMLTADADGLAGAFDSVGLPVEVIEPRTVALARALAPMAAHQAEVLLDATLECITAITTEAGRVAYVRRLESRGASLVEGGMPARDAFLSELRLTLGYVQRRDQPSQLDRVVLSGDEATCRLVADAIRSSLEMPVLEVEPSALVTAGGERLVTGAVAAIGLAARAEAER